MPCLNKMRVGIFGGAFDPPHLGHAKAVLAFLERAELDILYVIPSGKPPHKVISAGASDEDRLKMSELAFADLSENIRINDSELLDQGTCYSYLTVERIRTLHSDSEVFLFMGTDQFLAFETWKRFEYILQMCTLCVMDRFEDFSKLNEKKALLEENFGASILLLQEKAYIISSTAVRKELEKWGFSLSLSPAVNVYITTHGIYGALSDPERKALLDRAKATLSPHRFFHTLSVERETVRICRLLSLSEEDTKEMAKAALFHDLAKNMTDKEMISFLICNGEVVTEEDQRIPAVLHGRVAALMARHENALSEDALQAVYYHTTGRRGMSLKEKILYFADYIEETREHEACKKMRNDFYENLPEGEDARIAFLNRCVLKVMESTANYLQIKKIPCHCLGREALADLKQRIN